MKNDALKVKIISPTEILWEGAAEAVSSENTEGPFDILPEHANFITLIKNKPIIVHRADGRREFKYERAVIQVHENRISIYVQFMQKSSPAAKKQHT